MSGGEVHDGQCGCDDGWLYLDEGNPPTVRPCPRCRPSGSDEYVAGRWASQLQGIRRGERPTAVSERGRAHIAHIREALMAAKYTDRARETA